MKKKLKKADGGPHLYPWGKREQPKKINSKSLDNLDYMIDCNMKAIEKLEAEKKAIIQKFKIQWLSNVHGKGCGKMNPVGKLTKVIDTYDDYECGVGWDTRTNTGEFGFYCLHCGHRNRVFIEEKFQYELLRDYAKDYIVEHEKRNY